jgi:1-deoxy-D-xylulose-5-phosphate reductoisomerase
LNAANEVAVAAFLDKRLAYTKIAQVIEATLNWQSGQPEASLSSLDDIIALDELSRQAAHRAACD